MGSVYALSLRQLSGRWRLLVMTILAALPILMTAIVMASGDSPDVGEFEMVVFNGMLIGSIIPLVVLAIAAAAFTMEIEDNTLANLTLTPIPRWKIVVPKLLAAITVAAPFVVASAAVSSWIAFLGDFQATAAVTLAALVEVALYAAAFVWLGLVSAQAVGIGLLYIVLWEGLFAGFISGVRVLSIRYWSLGIMNALDERRFAEMGHLGTTAVVIVAVLTFTTFVVLAVRRLRRMDIP